MDRYLNLLEDVSILTIENNHSDESLDIRILGFLNIFYPNYQFDWLGSVFNSEVKGYVNFNSDLEG